MTPYQSTNATPPVSPAQNGGETVQSPGWASAPSPSSGDNMAPDLYETQMLGAPANSMTHNSDWVDLAGN